MFQKLKPRKCRRKICRKEFLPVTRWQDFCSGKCRAAERYQLKAKLLRKARKIVEQASAS